MHLYADDTQIYGFCCLSKVCALQDNVSACIDDVAVWMKSNRLQLSATKTEVLWCAQPRRQQQLPTEPLCIGCDTLQPVRHVRNLGIYIGNGLTMNTHGCELLCCSSTDTQHSAFCHEAGFTVSCHVARAVALGLWKCDSGRHFQIPVGSSARLICRARKYDHVSPLLQELHWLSVPERIKY